MSAESSCGQSRAGEARSEASALANAVERVWSVILKVLLIASGLMFGAMTASIVAMIFGWGDGSC